MVSRSKPLGITSSFSAAYPSFLWTRSDTSEQHAIRAGNLRGAVLAACWLAGGLLWVVATVVLVGVAGGFGVLIVLAASIYLVIWWVVPLVTRATLAFVLMIVDDARFPDCWQSCDVTMGQAWGYCGLTVAAGFGFSIIGQVVNAFGSQGAGWAVTAIVVSVLLSLVQYLFFAIYAVMVAHGLSDGHTRPPLSA